MLFRSDWRLKQNPKFLTQFIGKSANSPLEIGLDIFEIEDRASLSYEIAHVVKKNLIIFNVGFSKYFN